MLNRWLYYYIIIRNKCEYLFHPLFHDFMYSHVFALVLGLSSFFVSLFSPFLWFLSFHLIVISQFYFSLTI